MAHVVDRLDQPSTYKDRQTKHDRGDEKERLAKSSTLYVGNLSFFTTESQIYELFSQCASPENGGGIKRIIMGLDRNQRTPCGFAFVEYYLRSEALASMRYISGTKLDERVIRCDIDPGYLPGRELGRGKSGGQVRDEYREEYDPGRGGWGHQLEKERKAAEQRREDAANENYQMRHGGDVATGEGHEGSRRRGRSESSGSRGSRSRSRSPSRSRSRSRSASRSSGGGRASIRRGERDSDAEED